MPGLNIYFTHTFQHPKHCVLELFPNYKKTVLFSKNVVIESLAHPSYPVQVIEDDKFLIIVEGRIYEAETVYRDRIKTVAADFEAADFSGVSDFIASCNGEYLILILNKKTEDFIIFNDYLGRLPFYYRTEGGGMSREISSLCLLKEEKVSPEHVAEYLLFGYNLDDRTLYSNIRSLQSASMICFRQGRMRVEQLVCENFEDVDQSLTDLKAIGKNLAQKFIEAVDRRRELKGNILSLSGGLDSRAVLAALNRLGVDYTSVTYVDKKGSADADLEVVKELHRFVKGKPVVLELSEDDRSNQEKLIALKRGMNYSGMGFILEYFEKLVPFGTNFYTGDGGDKVLPDLTPLRKIFSEKDFLSYVFRMNKVFSLSEVEKLTGVDRGVILKNILQVFDSYPEKTYAAKYQRFLIKERGRKWLFEGEDRNRYFLNQQAPFYDLDFYKYAMKVPLRYKANYALFAEFLECLDAEIAVVKNANWNCSLIDRSTINFIYFRQKVKTLVPEFLLQIKEKDGIVEYVQELFNLKMFQIALDDKKKDYLKTVKGVMGKGQYISD